METNPIHRWRFRPDRQKPEHVMEFRMQGETTGTLKEPAINVERIQTLKRMCVFVCICVYMFLCVRCTRMFVQRMYVQSRGPLWVLFFSKTVSQDLIRWTRLPP